jgi:hypothetical protein
MKRGCHEPGQACICAGVYVINWGSGGQTIASCVSGDILSKQCSYSSMKKKKDFPFPRRLLFRLRAFSVKLIINESSNFRDLTF